MKEKKEIEKDTLQLETPPNDYNLLEIHCFLALKQLLIMYWNKQISSENASKIKMRIFGDYEKRYKQFDFEESMFKEYIERSNRTCCLRTKLRKEWKSDADVTEERLAEMLNMAMEVLSNMFEGEF